MLLCTACHDGRVYDRFKTMPDIGWEKEDTVTFALSPAKAAAVCLPSVGLRIDRTYPLSNLSLIVRQTLTPTGQTAGDSLPPAERTRTDTLSLNLTDARGLLSGQGINFLEYDLPLPHALSISTGDSLTVRIVHDMRRDLLPGVTDLGLVLRKQNR